MTRQEHIKRLRERAERWVSAMILAQGDECCRTGKSREQLGMTFPRREDHPDWQLADDLENRR